MKLFCRLGVEWISVGALGYLFMLVGVWVALRFVPVWPLQVSDFAVTGKGETVIVSQFQRSVHVHGADGSPVRRFRLPESGGTPMICVDESGNIYIARRRSVEVYSSEGLRKEVKSVDLRQPENWRLSPRGRVEHMGQTSVAEGSSPIQSGRLRRVARPGDVLFMQGDEGFTSADDSFLDDRGYRSFCASWYGGIAAYDKESKPFSLLRPPWFLRPFLLPLPGVPLALLAVMWLAILRSALGRGTADGEEI